MRLLADSSACTPNAACSTGICDGGTCGKEGDDGGGSLVTIIVVVVVLVVLAVSGVGFQMYRKRRCVSRWPADGVPCGKIVVLCGKFIRKPKKRQEPAAR